MALAFDIICFILFLFFLYKGSKEGFFVGNGVQDVSNGIDIMYDTIQTLL